MRVAETRAVNRALRKAYGIGLCSVDEIGGNPEPPFPGPVAVPAPKNGSNGDQSDGQPRLRDRLCLLIRQHNLDATQVKRYAAGLEGVVKISYTNLNGRSYLNLDGFALAAAEEIPANREK
jgi:hypothetical protein